MTETTRRRAGAPSKLDQVLAGLAAYYAAAQRDSALRISKVAIAGRCGGPRGVNVDTLREHAKADPRVAAWLARFEMLEGQRAEARAARDASLAAAATLGGDAPPDTSPASVARRAAASVDLTELPDAALEARVTRAVEEVTGVVQRFAGKRRRDRDVHDIVRVAFDLDEMLLQLHGCSARLTALATEVRRRHRPTRSTNADAELPIFAGDK